MKKIIFFVCAYQFFSFDVLVSSDQNSLFSSIATFAIISYVTTQYVNQEISSKELQSVDSHIDFNQIFVQDIKIDESLQKDKQIKKIQALTRGYLARKMIKQDNPKEETKKIETTNFYSEHSVKTNVSSLTGTTCDRQTPDSSLSDSSINLDFLEIENYCNQGFGRKQKNKIFEDNGFYLVEKN